MKSIHIFSVLLLSLCLCSCAINTKDITITSDSKNISFNNSYEYIYNKKEEQLYEMNILTHDVSVVTSGNILFMKAYNNRLYFIKEENNKEFTLKFYENGNIKQIYKIPLDKIVSCIFKEDSIYISDGHAIYSIDLNNSIMNLLIEHLNSVEAMAMIDDDIYYIEFEDNFDADNIWSNVEQESFFLKLSKVSIDTKKNEIVLDKIDNSKSSGVVNLLSTNNGIVGNFNIAFTSKLKQIILISKTGQVVKLTNNITDIDYLATDGNNIYYVDSENKKIMKMQLSNSNNFVFYNYTDLPIKDILGITNENIYLLNEDDDIIYYNINSDSYNMLQLK